MGGWDGEGGDREGGGRGGANDVITGSQPGFGADAFQQKITCLNSLII